MILYSYLYNIRVLAFLFGLEALNMSILIFRKIIKTKIILYKHYIVPFRNVFRNFNVK